MLLNKINQFLLVNLVFLLGTCATTGCNDEPREGTVAEEKKESPGQVNVVTNTMDFQVKDTLTAGWNTINYHNKSGEVHFILLEKYPEGRGIKDAEAEVVPVFQQAMNLIVAGKQEEGFAEFARLPEWFSKVVFVGGTGLISPGKTAQTTLQVSPGTYIIECYVKMPDGQFHSSMGMAKQLVFVDGNNENIPPEAGINIGISAKEGIVAPDSIKAGSHQFAVSFQDQQAYENFVGHDVHLVRLAEGADIKKLEDWMNWVNPRGLTSPAPAGFEFMGGTQEMPAGNTAYFSADLSPGNYALIAEVPDPAKKKLLYRFAIP